LRCRVGLCFPDIYKLVKLGRPKKEEDRQEKQSSFSSAFGPGIRCNLLIAGKVHEIAQNLRRFMRISGIAVTKSECLPESLLLQLLDLIGIQDRRHRSLNFGAGVDNIHDDRRPYRW
jgi:hypothetical protein